MTDEPEALNEAAQAAADRAYEAQVAEEDAEDLAGWTEERDRQLAQLTGCRHGAPGYLMAHAVEPSDVIWCSHCGALGEWVDEADPGHQIDFPVDWGGDPGLERGPGYSWSLPTGEQATEEARVEGVSKNNLETAIVDAVAHAKTVQRLGGQ